MATPISWSYMLFPNLVTATSKSRIDFPSLLTRGVSLCLPQWPEYSSSHDVWLLGLGHKRQHGVHLVSLVTLTLGTQPLWCGKPGSHMKRSCVGVLTTVFTVWIFLAGSQHQLLLYWCQGQHRQEVPVEVCPNCIFVKNKQQQQQQHVFILSHWVLRQFVTRQWIPRAPTLKTVCHNLPGRLKWPRDIILSTKL